MPPISRIAAQRSGSRSEGRGRENMEGDPLMESDRWRLIW